MIEGERESGFGTLVVDGMHWAKDNALFEGNVPFLTGYVPFEGAGRVPIAGGKL